MLWPLFEFWLDIPSLTNLTNGNFPIQPVNCCWPLLSSAGAAGGILYCLWLAFLWQKVSCTNTEHLKASNFHEWLIEQDENTVRNSEAIPNFWVTESLSQTASTKSPPYKIDFIFSLQQHLAWLMASKWQKSSTMTGIRLMIFKSLFRESSKWKLCRLAPVCHVMATAGKACKWHVDWYDEDAINREQD